MKLFALPALVLATIALSLPATAQETSATLELTDCRISAGRGFPGIKARCGTLLRHEDPTTPASPMLELFVAVVPALSLDPELDPLVPIAGGPGQASTEFYAGYAQAFEKIRRNRDIVLLDQRGTGRSAPMTCDSDDELVDIDFSRERTIAETEECLDALPHDPRFFTTSVAVRDLEALREALGYSKFNIYGISYGTRVAQHFMRRYPESTRSVILDGVVAPQIALGPEIAVAAQQALDAIFSRCDESEHCIASFPDIRGAFSQLQQSLAETPVTVNLAHPVTGRQESLSFGEDELAGALRLLSYHPNTVAIIPFLINEAANQNFAPLAAQFLMIQENVSEALNIGMHNAVVCTEDAPFFDSANIDRQTLLNTYIGPVQIEALDAVCSAWPAGILDEAFKQPVASDIPVLLLSGEVDPVTPPRYADLAAVDLGNARHLIGARQGHGQAARGCMPDIIAQFIRQGSVEELATECLEQLFAMPFFVDFSGPTP